MVISFSSNILIPSFKVYMIKVKHAKGIWFNKKGNGKREIKHEKKKQLFTYLNENPKHISLKVSILVYYPEKEYNFPILF